LFHLFVFLLLQYEGGSEGLWEKGGRRKGGAGGKESIERDRERRQKEKNERGEEREIRGRTEQNKEWEMWKEECGEREKEKERRGGRKKGSE